MGSNISYIIAVQDSHNLFDNFLDNLLSIIDIQDEVILFLDGVHNLKTISLSNNFKSRHNNTVIIQENRIVGYTVANNSAVKRSTGKYLCFLNTDTFPERNSVKKLISAFECKEKTGVVQGLLVYPQNLKIQSTGHIFGHYINKHANAFNNQNSVPKNSLIKRQAVSSAFYVTTKTLFDDNNGFDEHFFNSFQAMEFSLRLTLSGYACYVDTGAIAYHIQGASRNCINRDEVQQAAYFWCKHKNAIKEDLSNYLAQEMNKINLQKDYIAILISNYRMWKHTFSVLPLNVLDKIEIHNNTNYDLYSLISSSIKRQPISILFVCDNYNELYSKNKKWFLDRKRKGDDLIIDTHGNVVFTP